MEYYPVIATINYKDKWCKVEISLRCKPIEIIKYNCPKHKHVTGTRKDIIKYCTVHEDRFKWAWVEISQYNSEKLPTEIIQGETINCPYCFTEESTITRMNATPTKLYKVYTTRSGKSPFVNTDKIIFKYTSFKWKDGQHLFNFGTVAAYESRWADVRFGVEYFNKLKPKERYSKTDRKNKVKVKVTVPDVTEEQMDECFQKYKERKFVSLI